MIRNIFFGCAGMLLCVGTQALAAPLQFHAAMTSGAEVPPPAAAGTGTADASYDPATHMLTYTITFSGLSGPATMAHFHGPAAAGANAGVEVKLGMSPKSPIKGSTKLTDAQAKELESGLWYANVHTAKNPKGELRGQLEENK
jgi:hypothetical protein